MRFSLSILALALVSATAVLAQPEASKNGFGTLRSTVNPGVQKKVDAILGSGGKHVTNTGGAPAHGKRHEPDHSRAHDEDDPDDGDEGEEGEEGDNEREEHHGRDP